MTLPRSTQYRFHPVIHEVVAAQGGVQALAYRLHCSESQLYRALRNESASRRLQRDILAALDVDPLAVGSLCDSSCTADAN